MKKGGLDRVEDQGCRGTTENTEVVASPLRVMGLSTPNNFRRAGLYRVNHPTTKR